jgi:aspartate/methionine/tyrosine aminotransferase
LHTRAAASAAALHIQRTILPMFSRRAEWKPALNRLTEVRQALVRGDREILDLTVSNPTRAEIEYPLDELAEVMSSASREPYDPEPLGLRSAREAVAESLRCDAADVVITASTSESYSHLFKLLTDPGDAVVTATPSYPLLEHLASLELVELQTFSMEFQRRWELPAERAREAITAKTRALIVVNPNNPTGSYITAHEGEALSSMGLPVISDEVFFDYPLDTETPHSFAHSHGLTFVLGGLSKSAGLPHYKLGWIKVAGPASEKRDALHALELIADNYLSVATPVQHALPHLLRIGTGIRHSIQKRIARNLGTLRDAVPTSSTVLPVEGGWSGVVRVPRVGTDEDLAIALLEQDGVAVHPGYFFDFSTDGFIVVSLLTPPDTFDEGMRRIVRRLPS